MQLGRLTLMPGVRYDRFSLDADQTDPVFIASLKSEAADFADGAVSPKVGAAVRVTDVVTVHAQYARGFRAPPYHDINTGFTNPAGGYTSLPNATLRGEAYLTDSVMIRGSYARIEGVEILHDIAVPALAEETPLGSIAPNEGVLGGQRLAGLLLQTELDTGH